MQTLSTRQGQELLRHLRTLHGNSCDRCGWKPTLGGLTSLAYNELEFHSVSELGWRAHGSGVRARARFYEGEHLAGRLQLLCKPCHRQEHETRISTRLRARLTPPRKDPGFMATLSGETLHALWNHSLSQAELPSLRAAWNDLPEQLRIAWRLAALALSRAG